MDLSEALVTNKQVYDASKILFMKQLDFELRIITENFKSFGITKYKSYC